VSPHLWLAFVNADGLVIDDKTEACQCWVGHHYTELPGPVKVYAGFDPREVVGQPPVLQTEEPMRVVGEPAVTGMG
jgi:hypothetical protein